MADAYLLEYSRLGLEDGTGVYLAENGDLFALEGGAASDFDRYLLEDGSGVYLLEGGAGGPVNMARLVSSDPPAQSFGSSIFASIVTAGPPSRRFGKS